MAKVKELKVGMSYETFWGNNDYHKKKARFERHITVELEDGDDVDALKKELEEEVTNDVLEQYRTFKKDNIKEKVG